MISESDRELIIEALQSHKLCMLRMAANSRPGPNNADYWRGQARACEKAIKNITEKNNASS